ncbi:MAG: hypothetical protein ACNS64_05440, partial [Candidatus Halalkalibacterium sp. M3_1C_030]
MKQGLIVYVVISLLVIMFLYSQFIDEGKQEIYSGEPITDSLIVNEYPRLYEEVNNRSAEGIDGYLNHESMEIRKQAWRALASTPIDSVEPYIQKALESDLIQPWFAISMQPLSTDQLRAL